MKQSLAVKICTLVAALFIAGCASYQAHWDSRVGTYTYDQAVTELGPPDHQTRLTDDQTVAEWISRYNTGAPAGVATDFYGRPIGMQPTPTYTESRLRLTFDTNHVLTAWSRR